MGEGPVALLAGSGRWAAKLWTSGSQEGLATEAAFGDAPPPTHTHPGSAEAPSRVPYDRPSCASLSGSGLPPHHTGLPPWWPGSARGPLHSSVHASPTLTGQGTSAWVTLAFLLNPPQTPGSLPPPSPPRTEGVPSALHASAGAPPRPWGPSQTCPHPQAERQKWQSLGSCQERGDGRPGGGAEAGRGAGQGRGLVPRVKGRG